MNSSHLPRVDRWQLPREILPLGPLPLLMGILNVTPDSFSDAGRFIDAGVAIDRGLQLVEEGADILDIGGESTRPYSQPVTADEELRRVMPVLSELCRKTPVPVSIDTSKAAVAREAIAAGAQIINDVTGLTGDPGMVPLAAETRAAVCVMHMRGTPQTMQDAPEYGDVVGEVLDYLRRRRDALVMAGVPQHGIALDPGIGFGKKTIHNLELLSNAWRFHELGCPVLVGHSRKGYIGRVIDDEEADRTAGTIGTALAMARQAVQILRVHDVSQVRQALLVFQASGGLD